MGDMNDESMFPIEKITHSVTQPNLLFVKFVKYFFVGSAAAITEWLSFIAIIYSLRWSYIFSAIISFMIATSVNYILSVRFVFKKGRHKSYHEIMLVYLVSIIGLIINLTALGLCVEWLGIHVVISKVIATGVAFLWNFASRHLWVFEQ